VCIALLILWITIPDPTEGWAVLLEMNDYPRGYKDFPIDFVDIERIEEILILHNWNQSHIIKEKDTVTPGTIERAFRIVQSHVDSNDIVFVFIGAHGGYIRHDLHWETLFPELWDTLPTENKVLLVDSCFAGAFLPRDSQGYMGIASVSGGESAWAGLPEEKLPIEGFIFTYFLCESLKEQVSIEEGFAQAVPRVRAYMRDVVYPAFKDQFPPQTYYNLYNPHPVLIDCSPDPFYLKVEGKHPFSLIIPAFLIMCIGILCLWILVPGGLLLTH
jgi:hypothetical protein